MFLMTTQNTTHFEYHFFFLTSPLLLVFHITLNYGGKLDDYLSKSPITNQTPKTLM